MFQYGLQSFLDVFCILNLEKLYFVCLCWGQVPGKKPVKSKHDSIFAFVDITVDWDFYPNTSKKVSCFKDNSFLLKVLFFTCSFLFFCIVQAKEKKRTKEKKTGTCQKSFYNSETKISGHKNL